MSADNSICILKTGFQYRVKHLQATENLYWDEARGVISSEIQPKMIIQMFKDCRPTYCKKKAKRMALNIYKSLPICEYGISVFSTKKSWKQIKKEVKYNETYRME